MSREMVHRLHHYNEQSTRAMCDACGDIDIFWKSAGSGRPRRPVCGQAHRLDRIIQRNKNSDSAHARNEVNKARLRLAYLKEQALNNPRPPRGRLDDR